MHNYTPVYMEIEAMLQKVEQQDALQTFAGLFDVCYLIKEGIGENTFEKWFSQVEVGLPREVIVVAHRMDGKNR